MVQLGIMARALVDSGLAEMPKEKAPRKQKEFKCRRCQQPMQRNEGTNTMSCTNPKCSNFYIFSK